MYLRLEILLDKDVLLKYWGTDNRRNNMWYMNEEREQLKKMAHDFTQEEVKPFVKEMEEKNAFPHEILKKAAELGITGLIFPESCDGFGPNWVDFGICLEEIGKESDCVANALCSQYAATSIMAMIPDQKRIDTIVKPVVHGEFVLATAQCEPAGQTMLEHMGTHFDWDYTNNQVVINGGKIFCTNAGNAEYYLVTCKTPEPIQEPMGKFTYILVHKDTPGFQVGHIENKIGWHGSSTGQLYFNDCRVSTENIVASFDMNGETTYFGGCNIGVLMAAGALGGAEGVFEKALNYAKERKQGDKSLFESYQAMRFKFAELYMEIESLRGLVYGVLDDLDKGSQDVTARAWAAKLKGAEVFEHVASECIVLFGGNGIIVENGIERYLRDAKMNAIGCFALPHISDMIGSHL